MLQTSRPELERLGDPLPNRVYLILGILLSLPLLRTNRLFVFLLFSEMQAS